MNKNPQSKAAIQPLDNQDFANVRSDKAVLKALEPGEDVFFSSSVTKTNHRGKRQERLLILTESSMYNFKPKHAGQPQRRIPLEHIEVVFISQENGMNLVIRITGIPPIRLEMQTRNAFVRALKETANVPGRVKPLEVLPLSQSLMERAWKDEKMTISDIKHATMALTRGGSYSKFGETVQEEALNPSPPNQNKEKKTPPPLPPKKEKKSSNTSASESPPPAAAKSPIGASVTKSAASKLSTIFRRPSALPQPVKYVPKCPPCNVKVGVVQPIWSLVERALEPLLEEAKPPAGLIRCADILMKLVGESGPSNTESAIKAISALCFDKDAARALLKSLSDNVPILGGSALIDSLDALQRCEDEVVRKWAVKSLWKLLPMCMSENALPTTSNKWMNALNGESIVDEISNKGEAAFLATFFHGKINDGTHEKDAVRRIMKRKGSFNTLGNRLEGITPLAVQQAFGEILLQNFFDLQRRAGFAMRMQQEEGGKREKKRDEEFTITGVTESDCLCVMELLLNSLIRPHDMDRRVDVIGKRIRHSVVLPTLCGMLVLISEDSVRQSILKDLSLMLLRSETNLKEVLDIPQWQLLFIPLLQTVPKHERERTTEQRILHKYVLNLLTMVHTYCFKEPQCRGGPLITMLGSTFHSLATFADWNHDTISIARWILFGLLSQLGLTARLWWHDETAPEWLAFAQLVKTVETFVFFLPELDTYVPSKDAGRGIKNVQGSGVIQEEGDSDSDDDVPGNRRNPEKKRHKRKFSITPIYQLKGFEPVVTPLGPSDAISKKDSFKWIEILLSEAQGGEKNDDRRSALTKAKSGLHLNAETGKCDDILLVGHFIDFIKKMGITGVASEDQRRREAMSKSSKNQKGLLKNASEWCDSLVKIKDLLTSFDLAIDSNSTDAVSNTSKRIANFVEQRYASAKTKSTKLTSTQVKSVATKLESNVLRQRQLLKSKVENHSVATPVKVSTNKVIEIKATAKEIAPPPIATQGISRRASALSLGGNQTRYYSSVGGETDFVSPPPLPPMPPVQESEEKKKMKKSSSKFIKKSEGDDDSLDDGPPCDRCGHMCTDEFDMVEKFGHHFHADCFTCEECYLPLLKGDNPDVNNLFFEEGNSLKKFCSMDCRLTMLEKYGKNMCPGCMNTFKMGEKAIESCGKLFHVEHLKCNDCGAQLGLKKDEDYYPVNLSKNEIWPFCRECYSSRFRTCAKCNQGIEGKEEAIDALGHVYHKGHFGCFRCGEEFKSKDFFVDGHGEQTRALCEACWQDNTFTSKIACDRCAKVLKETDDAIELGGKIYHSKGCFVCHTCNKELVVGGVFEDDAGNPSCDSCYYGKKGDVCFKCKKIVEGELLITDGNRFHPACFCCPDCEGMKLGGRYFLKDGLPYCESHYLKKTGHVACQSCGLDLEQEKVEVEGGSFHTYCLCCNVCCVPLVVGNNGSKKMEINKGPDGLWYCKRHQNGMCAYEDCENAAWDVNGGPIFKLANEFYCQEHFEEKSKTYMEYPCERCGEAIEQGCGLEALKKWYHKDLCFVCFVCDEQFEDGEEFSVLRVFFGTEEPCHKKCLPAL